MPTTALYGEYLIGNFALFSFGGKKHLGVFGQKLWLHRFNSDLKKNWQRFNATTNYFQRGWTKGPGGQKVLRQCYYVISFKRSGTSPGKKKKRRKFPEASVKQIWLISSSYLVSARSHLFFSHCQIQFFFLAEQFFKTNLIGNFDDATSNYFNFPKNLDFSPKISHTKTNVKHKTCHFSLYIWE